MSRKQWDTCDHPPLPGSALGAMFRVSVRCFLHVQEVKVFDGHEAGVLHAISNPYGNLLVSGGRDSAIKFWDVMSGVCVKTLRCVKERDVP